MDSSSEKDRLFPLDFLQNGLISASCRLVQDFEEREWLWRILCLQKRHSLILYNIPPQSLAQEGKKAWTEMTGQNAWLFALEFSVPALLSAKLGGLAWVNGFMGRSAQVHFCPLVQIPLPTATQAGLVFLDHLRATNALDSLLGLTPRPYLYALRFVERLGFTRLGVLPGACFLAGRGLTGTYADGILNVFSFR